MPLSSQLRVMLIEDNATVAVTMQLFLTRAGIATAWARTGAEAHDLKARFAPHVVLVDIELPDTTGHAIIEWLYQLGDCGIIVVSTRGAVTERIASLEMGADDYITKPPQLRELLARIRAVHRRGRHRVLAETAGGKRMPSPMIGRFRLDLQRRLVTGEDNQPVPMTTAEFNALVTMLDSAGHPVSRQRLSEVALRRQWRPDDRGVDQLIFSIRRKLGDANPTARLIRSVRGAGYMLAAADEAAREPAAATATA